MLSTLPHPNADRLQLADVDVGLGHSRLVVVGGLPVIRPGDLVPVALPGTRLQNGEKIRVRQYRGIRSYAELLSSDELGWTEMGVDAVLVLSEDFCVGEELPEIPPASVAIVLDYKVWASDHIWANASSPAGT